jgi:putative ABC transport system permease protein
LILQFLGESFVLCFFAFIIAIVFAQSALPVFNKLAGKELSVFYLFDIKLAIGYFALFIITALLAGSYPALVLSDYNPVQTLYGRFLIKGKNYLQRSLVVLQFALASFLIIATLIVFSQFKFLTTEKLGYDDKNLAISIKTELTRKEAALFKNELMKTPYYIGVAPKNKDWWNTGAKLDNGNEIFFVYETVDESYIPLLNIPIIAGRNFSSDFPSDSSHSVLVNETFVRTAGWKEPIGKNVNFFIHGEETYTVIGVVKDHHFQSLHEKIKPQLFTMKPGNTYGSLYVKIKPEHISAGLQQLERTYKNIFPLNPYSYRFKDAENIRNYEVEEKWKQIMLFASVINIFISCFGLFGLSVLSAEKRIKEIGIRKVLGASVRGIAVILSKDFLKLVAVALLIAMPIVWIAASRWLENYPFHITLSWWMFASSGLLVVMLAMTTVSFQAIKAGFANPAKSLRSE